MAIALSDRPERFQRLKTVCLFGAGNEGTPAEVESVWIHRGRAIFKFRGVDSISDAERLRGLEVRIPRDERLELPEGEYYRSDLIGFEVVERLTEHRLGVLAEWLDYGGAPLLRVEPEGSGEELLIPFARSICVRIDLDGRRVLVDLPEGLKDLNRR